MFAKAIFLFSTLLAVNAHGMSSDGMGMGGDSSNGTMAAMMMTPWLHFTLGDALWFKSWVPQSKGALAGACIGLFALAIVERWYHSMCALMELHWQEQYVFFSIVHFWILLFL